MTNLREDAESILSRGPCDQRPGAAKRLARAYLDAFRIRTVSENCHDLVIVDREHYEGLLARCVETR